MADLSMARTNHGRQTVLVLGAAGRFGSAACQAFASFGWRVFAQARKDLPSTIMPHVSHIKADVLDTQSVLVQLPTGMKIDLIVHAVNPDYAKWDRLLPPVTAAVIALAKRTGATVMIPGNVYNFGKDLPEVLDESTPFQASTSKAQQRIAMEQSFQDAAADGVATIIIRAGDFIGGNGTWLDMAIAKSLRKGVFTAMGPQHLTHAWAYLPDLAQSFVKVAHQRHRLPSFEVLHYPGICATQHEMQAAFQHLLGHSLRTKLMPWSVLKIMAWFSPLMRALMEMRYLWLRPHRLSGEKLTRLIGCLPQVSLQQALREYLPVTTVMKPRYESLGKASEVSSFHNSKA